MEQELMCINSAFNLEFQNIWNIVLLAVPRQRVIKITNKTIYITLCFQLTQQLLILCDVTSNDIVLQMDLKKRPPKEWNNIFLKKS